MSSTESNPTAAGTTTYHEPSLPTLLILLSFLYFLQVGRSIANRLLGAGLIGEIAVGVIYGPVAKILPVEWEETFIVLGYIGLVLIVFEGGLTLRPSTFIPLLPLALFTAAIGILLPMAFTFAAFSAPSFGYPPLEAFTAGSALGSTSLGTTFFVLKSAGPALANSKVGQILAGAALIDDVIALVLLSVITSLSSPASATNLGWTIGRPLVASVAMVLLSPLVSWMAGRALRSVKVQRLLEKRLALPGMLFIGVGVLGAFLAIAYYAGTTMLLGAYLAGYWLTSLPLPTTLPTFVDLFEELVLPLQTYIFIPTFFGSIGFSIPFLSLWNGGIVWRGIVYSILMTLGKLLAGSTLFVALIVGAGQPVSNSSAIDSATEPDIEMESSTEAERGGRSSDFEMEEKGGNNSKMNYSTKPCWEETVRAALFLGLALVARGEIGILILQVAYTSGGPVLSTDAYYVAIWAVGVCTVVGPVAFGSIVRRWGKGIERGSWGSV